MIKIQNSDQKAPFWYKLWIYSWRKSKNFKILSGKSGFGTGPEFGPKRLTAIFENQIQ